jgi:hypothetical protein
MLDMLERRLCLTAFTDVIDNPYLPMLPGATYIYRGVDGEDAVSVRVNVTSETKLIMGVTTTVVREREYVDGELVEDTRDFFAQDKAGNVWYFGEASREIEDGQVVGTEGSWEAGVDGAFPGIIMRARPAVGDEYQQEGAPGVAEDRAEVVAFGQKANVPFGRFGDCLKTEESNPLEPGNLENKFYAPGIGLVLAQETDDGGEVLRLVDVRLPQSAFADEIDNPFLPFLVGTTLIYRGTDDDGASILNRVNVTSETKVVAGVTTTVVRDREFIDGELVEDTRDFYAQDLAGNVWYFGEASREIENGVVVSTEGSWEAGIGGAKPGIIMRSHPGVGDFYKQENAPGVAEDQALVVGLAARVRVPVGTFGACLQTRESTPLEPGVSEDKFYAPGVGFVMSQGISGTDEILRLVEIRFA